MDARWQPPQVPASTNPRIGFRTRFDEKKLTCRLEAGGGAAQGTVPSQWQMAFLSSVVHKTGFAEAETVPHSASRLQQHIEKRYKTHTKKGGRQGIRVRVHQRAVRNASERGNQESQNANNVCETLTSSCHRRIAWRHALSRPSSKIHSDVRPSGCIILRVFIRCFYLRATLPLKSQCSNRSRQFQKNSTKKKKEKKEGHGENETLPRALDRQQRNGKPRPKETKKKNNSSE